MVSMNAPVINVLAACAAEQGLLKFWGPALSATSRLSFILLVGAPFPKLRLLKPFITAKRLKNGVRLAVLENEILLDHVLWEALWVFLQVPNSPLGVTTRG